MPFDGIMLHLFARELNELAPFRVQKIHQPLADYLTFSLRNREITKNLLISVSQNSARAQFTNLTFENPAAPPNFCMLLRKYLIGAMLKNAQQVGLDRILRLNFSRRDEIGNAQNLTLIIEILGRTSNIILTHEDGKIIDALRRSDISADRVILPSVIYAPPEKRDKINFLADFEDTKSAIDENNFAEKLEGISPLVAREILHRFDNQTKPFAEILNDFRNEIINHKSYFMASKSGRYTEFSFTNLTHLAQNHEIVEYKSQENLLDDFYKSADENTKFKQISANLHKNVQNLHNRAKRKTEQRKIDLENCKNKENLRIYGEILLANLEKIEKGAKFADLTNFYDENASTIRIKLDDKLSPAQNAQKYFKDYKKLATAEKMLANLIEQGENEANYLETVLDSIARTNDVAVVDEIREELVQSGFMREQNHRKKPKKSVPLKPFATQIGGFTILTGRTNLQNDELTFKIAKPYDVWLHVKNFAGSHTIIQTNRAEVPNDVLEQAAYISAEHSKAKNMTTVPIDVTLAKDVKRQPNGKPGQVFYKNYKTIFVNLETNLNN